MLVYNKINNHKKLMYFLAATLTILSLFLIKPIYSHSYAYNGSDLRKKPGFVLIEKWVKTQNTKKGIFTYGPYVKLTAGEYKITLDYELSKNTEAAFDIVTDKGNTLLYKGDLRSSQQQMKHKIKLDKSCEIEIRTFYSGKGDLTIKKLKIIPLTFLAKYDVLLLITLFTLFFLFYFKIFAWLMKLKWIQNKSRIDISFLAVFFILLFLPMSYISDAQKSEQENRMLAKFPNLYINGQINKSYGTEFEKWFNDRFFGRSLLLDIFHSVIYHTNSIYQNNKAIYIKENGWMFNLPLLAKNYNKTQLSEIKNNLHKFSEFLKQNNIKLYLLITPKKESIYSDLLESYGYNYNADNIIQRKYHSLFDGYNVTYPYKELKSASKKDYVFFKQSHHWTDWGAYIGYQALMKNIVKDFHDIPIISLENFKTYNNLLIRDEWDRTFHNGHTINLLGLSKYQDEILKTHYIYYTPLSDKLPEISISKYTKFFSNSEGKYRLFLIGNSQNENLLNFLPYSFNEINYLRLNKGQLPSSEQFKFMKHYKNLLLDFSPDIVVICISAEIMHEFINFYKE